MKKILSILLFSLLINHSFGQDISTLLKLNDFSVSLGITENTSLDTLLIKTRYEKMKIKTAEQLIYLLRAAECYSIKDYENSNIYIQKVRTNFGYPEYNNLKFLLLIVNYAHLKEIKNTAKYFYILNKTKFIDLNNLQTIKSEIRNNFTKDDFNEELSSYYYYHERLKIINEIEFTE